MKKHTPRHTVPLAAPQGPSVTRLELGLVAAILLAGAALRLYAFSHSAVEHFDEGVYASNVYFGAPDYAYPQQRFYAPPLLPALIEAGMIAGLPPNVAALLPSFLAGCGTIIALWWFGRSWFSPAVGLGAAMLAALSDFHIAYSATALTDVLLGLWLVLAVDAIARSLVNGDYRWAIGAGIYTGLAWWTKYNGWLPLAIEAAALPLMWLLIRSPHQQMARWLGCFAVTVLTAAAIWAPYFFSLQPQGGYGPIAANHAKYVVGLGGWLDSLSRQIASQLVMEGPATWIAVGGSLLIVAVMRMGGRSLPGRWVGRAALVVIWGILLALCTWRGSTVFVLGIAALFGLARAWWGAVSANSQPAAVDVAGRRSVALALVIAWWGGMSFATPCYTPYARLLLPWLLATWLSVAMLCDEIARTLVAMPAWPRTLRESGPLLLPTLLFVAVSIALFAGPMTRVDLPTTMRSDANRRGLEHAAYHFQPVLDRNAARDADAGTGSHAVYVYGEPALLFQLKTAGVSFVGPVQDIPAAAVNADGTTVPTYLAFGPHARRDPQFRAAWKKSRRRWKRVASFPYRPSAIVRLDLIDPRQEEPQKPWEDIEVYRLVQP